MSRIAKAAGFVHLRVHSAYSLLEGALTIKQLAELAAKDSMPALAITDTGNLFGTLVGRESCGIFANAKLASGRSRLITGCSGSTYSPTRTVGLHLAS